jgi:hypothetical protein
MKRFVFVSNPKKTTSTVSFFFLDIRGLLKNDAVLNQLAPNTFRQYNTDQMIKVKTPKGDDVCWLPAKEPFLFILLYVNTSMFRF